MRMRGGNICIHWRCWSCLGACGGPAHVSGADLLLGGGAVYCGVLLPSLGFFYAYGLMVSFVFDHLQYQASIALFALAGAAVALVDTRLAGHVRWVERVAVAAVLVALALVARSYAGVFQDQGILGLGHLGQKSHVVVCRCNLAMWYEHQGQDAASLVHHRLVLELEEQLARENPTVDGYRANVAVYWNSLGLPERR